MAKLYISEFTTGRGQIGTVPQLAPPQPNVTDQSVGIGGASAQSAAFNAKTNFILVAADTACEIAIGANPVAVSGTSFRLPANIAPVGFCVVPGQMLAVIQSA